MIFNQEKLKLFKKTYQVAEETKTEIFVFEGEQFLTGYAKILIECLDQHYDFTAEENK